MKRILGSVFAILGLVAVLGLAALSCIPIWPFVVLPRGRRERYAIWGARWFAAMCLYPVLWARITFVGRENLPSKPGFLIISNHRSWADVAMLIALTASQGISKKEVAYLPFFGLNGWISGAIFFDRSSAEARARVLPDALRVLRGGGNLHLFPEGTRTRDGWLREKVHLKLVKLCWDNGIDVVPACVWGTEGALPVGEFVAYPGARMGLEVGPRVERADFTDGDAFAEACWERVREMAGRRGVDAPFGDQGTAAGSPNASRNARRASGSASA